jgi:hypothetical protein
MLQFLREPFYGAVDKKVWPMDCARRQNSETFIPVSVPLSAPPVVMMVMLWDATLDLQHCQLNLLQP